MKKYIVREGEWFDPGTEVTLIQEYSKEGDKDKYGLFGGVKNGIEDEEVCRFDEFDVVEVVSL